MAYQVFERSAVRVVKPALSVMPDGRIFLNAAATRVFLEARVRSVLLLWDKANHRLALKAAEKGDQNAYAVSISRGRLGSISAKSLLSYIGWSAPKRAVLIAEWNEKGKMFEVTLPSQCVRSGKGTER